MSFDLGDTIRDKSTKCKGVIDYLSTFSGRLYYGNGVVRKDDVINCKMLLLEKRLVYIIKKI